MELSFRREFLFFCLLWDKCFCTKLKNTNFVRLLFLVGTSVQYEDGQMKCVCHL